MAARAVATIMHHLTPSLLELMDAVAITAVQAFKLMGLEDPPAALLFGQSDDHPALEHTGKSLLLDEICAPISRLGGARPRETAMELSQLQRLCERSPAGPLPAARLLTVPGDDDGSASTIGGPRRLANDERLEPHRAKDLSAQGVDSLVWRPIRTLRED